MTAFSFIFCIPFGAFVFAPGPGQGRLGRSAVSGFKRWHEERRKEPAAGGTGSPGGRFYQNVVFFGSRQLRSHAETVCPSGLQLLRREILLPSGLIPHKHRPKHLSGGTATAETQNSPMISGPVAPGHLTLRPDPLDWWNPPNISITWY